MNKNDEDRDESHFASGHSKTIQLLERSHTKHLMAFDKSK